MKRPINSKSRRGVAMLLIIISVAMATLLASAYLASRDNSGAIGANVTEAAVARWASESGIDYGVVILQTETNWRTKHVGGKLIDDYVLGDASFDLDLMDIETSAPPTESTQNVLLTATAVANGVEKVSTALAFVPVDEGKVVDVDLGEFALFAEDSITLDDNAIIARWTEAPKSKIAPRIGIGTQSVDALDIQINDSSEAVDTTVYSAPGASSSLVSVTSQTTVQQEPLSDSVQLLAAPSPGVAGPTPLLPPANLSMISGTQTLLADNRYSNVTLDAGSTLNLQGDITLVAERTLQILDDSIVTIDGNVKIVVWDDLVLNLSSIVLMPDATMTLFVADDVVITGSYLGDEDPTAETAKPGKVAYMDPSRLIVYGMTAALLDPQTWLYDGATIIKGRVYAPDAAMYMQDTATLYGNVTTARAALVEDSAIFYDPGLNSGRGYTNPDSQLYDVAGDVKATYRAIASLDTAALTAVAITEGVQVKSTTEVLGTKEEAVEPVVLPTQPTPRPIEVDVSYTSIGIDESLWEGKGDTWGPSAQRVEQSCRDLATKIGSTATASFTGATLAQKLTKRTELVNRSNAAANAILASDFAAAIVELKFIYDRSGGDLLQPQYMVAGTAQSTTKTEALRLYDAASNL